MYGLFTYIYHKNQPHVGKYTIHGSYGTCETLPTFSAFSNQPEVSHRQELNGKASDETQRDTFGGKDL